MCNCRCLRMDYLFVGVFDWWKPQNKFISGSVGSEDTPCIAAAMVVVYPVYKYLYKRYCIALADYCML